MFTGVVFVEERVIGRLCQNIKYNSESVIEKEREIPHRGLGVLPVGVRCVCTGCLSRDILLYPHLWNTI